VLERLEKRPLAGSPLPPPAMWDHFLPKRKAQQTVAPRLMNDYTRFGGSVSSVNSRDAEHWSGSQQSSRFLDGRLPIMLGKGRLPLGVPPPHWPKLNLGNPHGPGTGCGPARKSCRLQLPMGLFNFELLGPVLAGRTHHFLRQNESFTAPTGSNRKIRGWSSGCTEQTVGGGK